MPDPSLYEIPGLIVNPGAHWVPENGSSPEAAAYNMTVLAADVAAAGETVGSVVPLIEPTPEQDRLLMGGTRFQEVHDGRYPFLLTVNGEVRVIEMPGLPIEEVRYIQAEGQSIWDFPRVFIDGSSWVWCYAVSVLSKSTEKTEL